MAATGAVVEVAAGGAVLLSPFATSGAAAAGAVALAVDSPDPEDVTSDAGDAAEAVDDDDVDDTPLAEEDLAAKMLAVERTGAALIVELLRWFETPD